MEVLKSKHHTRICDWYLHQQQFVTGTYINNNFDAVILCLILSKPVHLEPSSLK